MEDDKIHFMNCRSILTVLILAMTGLKSVEAICPIACRCQNDLLKTSCSSGALEFVPIQLNPELHELDLSHNRIVQMHFSFPFYEKLIFLNLSYNRIKTLGNGNFNSQRNLTHLDLNNNEILYIKKDSLTGLKSLTYLDLSKNSLEEIQVAAFRELQSLSILKLLGNKLLHLERGLFVSTKNLKELYLNDNQFLEIPTDSLADTLHLMYLSLSKNYIREVKDGEMPNLPELYILLLDDNVITEIHQAGLATVTALDHLDLSNNNLKIIPTESLSKLFNLSILKLSGNFISYIPPVAFRGLFNLKILDIDRLETLKKIDGRAFVDNINLNKVNLNHNRGVTKLPTRLFYGNPKITSISVRYNRLQTMEAIHFPLDQLHELNVGGNPLKCNCSLRWLWKLVQEYRSKSLKPNGPFVRQYKKFTNLNLTLDVNDIKCDGPEELRQLLLVSAPKHHMNCSDSWTVVLLLTGAVIFSVIIIGGVLYFRKKRKSQSITNDLSIQDNLRSFPANNIPQKVELCQTSQIEKCMLSTPIVIHNDYRTLPSWDAYGVSAVNIYEQLNNSKDRVNIVYV